MPHLFLCYDLSSRSTKILPNLSGTPLLRLPSSPPPAARLAELQKHAVTPTEEGTDRTGQAQTHHHLLTHLLATHLCAESSTSHGPRDAVLHHSTTPGDTDTDSLRSRSKSLSNPVCSSQNNSFSSSKHAARYKSCQPHKNLLSHDATSAEHKGFYRPQEFTFLLEETLTVIA